MCGSLSSIYLGTPRVEALCGGSSDELPNRAIPRNVWLATRPVDQTNGMGMRGSERHARMNFNWVTEAEKMFKGRSCHMIVSRVYFRQILRVYTIGDFDSYGFARA
jgi:hypothetical protein